MLICGVCRCFQLGGSLYIPAALEADTRAKPYNIIFNLLRSPPARMTLDEHVLFPSVFFGFVTRLRKRSARRIGPPVAPASAEKPLLGSSPATSWAEDKEPLLDATCGARAATGPPARLPTGFRASCCTSSSCGRCLLCCGFYWALCLLLLPAFHCRV